MNRVTDVALPEDVFREIEEGLMSLWQDASEVGDRRFPHEYLYDLLIHGELEFDIDPEKSWLACAADANLPIFTPGWEDSTLGNILATRVLDRTVKDSSIIKGGLEAMQALADWYREDDSPTGILQVGGGIAGDFAISVVPMLDRMLAWMFLGGRGLDRFQSRGHPMEDTQEPLPMRKSAGTS